MVIRKSNQAEDIAELIIAPLKFKTVVFGQEIAAFWSTNP
jgi:hypothetical protein